MLAPKLSSQKRMTPWNFVADKKFEVLRGVPE
jgi:hypothetical protein